MTVMEDGPVGTRAANAGVTHVPAASMEVGVVLEQGLQLVLLEKTKPKILTDALQDQV